MSQYSVLAGNWPWLLLSSVVLCIAYFASKLIRHRRFYADKPTPPHSLFWGNLKSMGEATKLFPSDAYITPLFSYFLKEFSLDGLYYLDIWPFGQPFLVVSDPELASQISFSPDFDRHPMTNTTLAGLVGNKSIFSTYGKEWQRQRQWFTTAFSLNHLLTLVPGMIQDTLLFRQKLTQLAVTKKEFSMNDAMGSLTMDVIGRSIGDFELRSQSNYSAVQYNFQKAVDWAEPTAPWYKKIFKQTMMNWYISNLDTLLMPMIKEKLKAGASGKSFLALAQKGYLKTKTDELKGSGTKVDPGQDQEFLEIALDNVKTFFTAGFDTTSSTLSYMFYLLSTHPDILEKVRAEHNDVFGPSLELTLEVLNHAPQTLSKLVLTLAVLKETMRLYPIGVTIKSAKPGTRLAYKGREYPMDNHMVAVFSTNMQRNPAFWSDPSAFDPERWLDPNNTDAGKDNGAWMPFEKGPRNCIGQQLALIEMRIIMLLTLRYFDFEPRLKEDGASIPGFGGLAYQVMKLTAKPKDGMPMVVRLREG